MPNYIYALLCPSGNIRYIGKTNDPTKRLRRHISRAKYHETKSHAANWIRSLLRDGKKPELRILEELDDSADWVSREIALIEEHRKAGHDLTNATAGGEGVCGLDEASLRKRVAAAAITKALPENKERYSRTLREVYACPEMRARVSKIHKERWADPALREKASEEFVGSSRQKAMLAGLTDDARKRQGQTFKEKHNDPAFRAKMAATKIEINARPEVKASKTAKSRANWADPVYVAKHAESMRLHRESIAAFKATPEGQALEAERAAHKKARDIAYGRARRAEAAEKRRAEKAAMLAAATSAPYTESS